MHTMPNEHWVVELSDAKMIKTRQNHYKMHAKTDRHVGPTASISGLGNWVDQLSADTKVTHLDIAQRIEQNVRWLHV